MGDPKSFLLAFGNRVKDIRLSKGFSQAKLAIRIWGQRQARPHITRIEKGTSNLQLFTIYRLAQALEVSTSYLFEGLEYGLGVDNPYGAQVIPEETIPSSGGETGATDW